MTTYTPTASEQAALDQLQAKVDELFDHDLGLVPFTRANFVAILKSAIGTPYRLGGIDPFNGGADCSGLILWAAQKCGYTPPRTTETEWALLQAVASPSLGDLVEFNVPGDNQAEPAHVGAWISPGVMIDDPHTGATVSIQPIPNEPGVIWVKGYRTMPFVPDPVNPPPPVGPTPPQQIYKPLTGRYGVLNKPVVVIIRRPQNDGYWEIGADGGMFAFGAAAELGSLANIHLVAPIIGGAATPSGVGLALCATDGGVFCFGDAPFKGSMGGKQLAAPVVSMAMTPSGNGYWLSAADGGIFAFGDAAFFGSI